MFLLIQDHDVSNQMCKSFYRHRFELTFAMATKNRNFVSYPIAFGVGGRALAKLWMLFIFAQNQIVFSGVYIWTFIHKHIQWQKKITPLQHITWRKLFLCDLFTLCYVRGGMKKVLIFLFTFPKFFLREWISRASWAEEESGKIKEGRMKSP